MGAATGPKSSAGLCTGQQCSCCPPHSRLNLLRDWVICPQTRLDLEAKTYPKVGASILRSEPEGQCGGGAGKQWRKRRVSGLKGTLWAGQGWSKSSSPGSHSSTPHRDPAHGPMVLPALLPMCCCHKASTCQTSSRSKGQREQTVWLFSAQPWPSPASPLKPRWLGMVTWNFTRNLLVGSTRTE